MSSQKEGPISGGDKLQAIIIIILKAATREQYSSC